MDDGLPLACLGPVSDTNRQRLGEILWGWTLCGQCKGNPSCEDPNCSWNLTGGLYAFWDSYRRLSEAYSPERLGRRAAIRNHEELLDIVEKVKAQPVIPRKDILREIFEVGDQDGEKPPTSYDQNRAFKIAASLVLLMDFGVLHDAANISSRTFTPVRWRDDQSIDAFIAEAFQSRSGPTITQATFSDLKAKKLTKHAKLRLQATNDIRSHLLLDKKEKIVWVFHQSTVLREILRSANNIASPSILPREVVLEVLDTITTVLFPPDLGSQKLLAYLVLKHGWDKGLVSDMSTPYRREDDPEVSFNYFGDRLEELHRELLAPTPNGWLQRRLQRRSEAYMLMATMYGVIIAVTLGFFSLVAAVFQSWVAWQQWKHPVT
jgi:hypothetical protein